jgi:putative ABC transport system permease protein
VKFLHLVWSNLKRKKLRTSLTILSVFVAFMLFGFLCAIKEAFTAGVSMANADRLITRHKVSLIMTLPRSYQERIERIDGVDLVQHWSWFGGIYQDEPKNFFGTFPVDPDRFLKMYPEYIVSPQDRERWVNKRTGALVGRQLIERFGWKIGDQVPIKSPIWPRKGDQPWEFEICGVYDGTKKGTDTSGFFFHYDYFDEARERGQGEVGWYVVRVKDSNRAAEVAKAIDMEFENSPSETKSEPEGAFAAAFVQQIGDIGKIVIGVMSAVFFTILLVAGNTMAQSVRERTAELGVLKALGFSNEGVLALVLAESCVIAALGGLAGLGLVLLITSRGSPAPAILPVFYLPVRYVVTGMILILMLGLIAGIVPALVAMRLRVAVALGRHE